MRAHVFDVAPRATAVVATTTTWEEFPALWRTLLDEVYAFVRPRPELSPEPGPGPDWRNVMLYKDDVPSVEVGVLVAGPFAPEGRVVPSLRRRAAAGDRGLPPPRPLTGCAAPGQ